MGRAQGGEQDAARHRSALQEAVGVGGPLQGERAGDVCLAAARGEPGQHLGVVRAEDLRGPGGAAAAGHGHASGHQVGGGDGGLLAAQQAVVEHAAGARG
ncbi:hypothetical protein GCM10020220_030770 [Nonomuraea rubra]